LTLICTKGEQQRIAMARLFYHRPSVAVLDECTSALNVEHQEKCMFISSLNLPFPSVYQSCQSKEMTFISVAHRKEVMAWHDSLLLLDGKGHWKLSALPHDATPHSDNKKIVEGDSQKSWVD
jgi:ABC-type uncharacterized transport system fused permease/ATPase subunit